MKYSGCQTNCLNKKNHCRHFHIFFFQIFKSNNRFDVMLKMVKTTHIEYFKTCSSLSQHIFITFNYAFRTSLDILLLLHNSNSVCIRIPCSAYTSIDGTNKYTMEFPWTQSKPQCCGWAYMFIVHCFDGWHYKARAKAKAKQKPFYWCMSNWVWCECTNQTTLWLTTRWFWGFAMEWTLCNQPSQLF